MDYCRQRILTITFLLERYLEIGLEKWTPAVRLLSKCAYIMPTCSLSFPKLTKH